MLDNIVQPLLHKSIQGYLDRFTQPVVAHIKSVELNTQMARAVDLVAHIFQGGYQAKSYQSARHHIMGNLTHFLTGFVKEPVRSIVNIQFMKLLYFSLNTAEMHLDRRKQCAEPVMKILRDALSFRILPRNHRI